MFTFSYNLNQNFSIQSKVVLELTTVLPNENEIKRWFGEPVELVIIPSNLFYKLKNNDEIVLKERYVPVCMDFMSRTNASFVVRCAYDDPLMSTYPKCLRRILFPVKEDVKHE